MCLKVQWGIPLLKIPVLYSFSYYYFAQPPFWFINQRFGIQISFFLNSSLLMCVLFFPNNFPNFSNIFGFFFKKKIHHYPMIEASFPYMWKKLSFFIFTSPNHRKETGEFQLEKTLKNMYLTVYYSGQVTQQKESHNCRILHMLRMNNKINNFGLIL